MSSEGSPSLFDEINPTPELTETPGRFTISYEDVEQELPLGLSDAYHLNQHQKPFLASLARSEAQTDGKISMSGAALTFRFMEYLLGRNVPPGTLIRLFYAVHSDIMQKKDVHNFVRDLPDGTSTQKSILRTFMKLQSKLAFPLLSSPPALPRLAQDPRTSVMMAFGGQGASNSACVDELAELYSIYQPLIGSLVASLSATLKSLSHHPDTKSFYLGREINVLEWLAEPSTRPEKNFIASAAISFPIIGLTGLLHYCIICKLLGKTPGEMGQLLSGITGHSQGIVVAAAVAKSHSWESFFDEARWAVELLFWMGYESHVAAPGSSISISMINESVQNGYGIPSHMLLVRGIRRRRLEEFIATNNKYLRKHEQLYLSLINSSKDHVVAGPPKSLQGLITSLRRICALDGADQSRIPYSKRKPVILFQYLPISSPFHSPYLQAATERVKNQMAKSWPETATISSLRIPVFHTKNGADMRKGYASKTDITGLVVEAVTTNVVDWPDTLRFHGDKRASHIIALGSGRFSDMVHKTVDGYGVRVIDGTRLDGTDSSTIGNKAEIFTQSLPDPTVSSASWGEKFQPRLVMYSDGYYHLETRLNSVLRAPPIITAGMTPTTVPWDFVASVIKAGYHIELAGGGYHNAAAMEAAIEKVAANIPAGRGITCNLIYVDPKAIGYQIPLIRQLVRRGVPIEGLTIGAGVPSPEIAAEYIETLGIKHISFKPGSVRAIREVIEIAKRHPTFPILLQWTGGRGGGHHSCEDFHEPLIEMYSEIRRHENIYLVVGSGFGDGAGILPYLTGSWSRQFGKPSMPCDGVLLGSRMMVATDAHTSAGVKKLLIKAPGVENAKWENSYLQADASGGVLTVTSEMGQPIHKLATRGVRLWKELDDTIFNLPKPERKPALLKRKAEIIRRLNADFAKPWFGRNANGQPVDVEDMTYAEIISRLAQLMYVIHQQRWVSPSYRELVSDFAVRALERLGSGSLETSWLDEPESLAQQITKVCPDLAVQLIHPEDARFFIQSCKKRGRKPVNFVVALDDDFEHWFKKDSLWQSEDLDAVLEQDPERVCILQSPVSVRYSTRDDQSAKDILDEIHGDLVAMMRGMVEYNVRPKLRLATTLQSRPTPENIIVDQMDDRILYKPLPGHELPSRETWIERLKPHAGASLVALMREETLFELSSKRSRPNPFREIFAPQHGYSLVFNHSSKEARLRDETTGNIVVAVKPVTSKHLRVEIIHKDPAVPSGCASLVLDWEYDERTRQLIDATVNRDRRVQEFYAHLWLGQKDAGREGRLTDIFSGGKFELTQELQSSLHSVVSQAFIGASPVSPTDVLPLESAVIASWEAIMRPLLINDLQGDLMRLVHQSINVEYVSGASPLLVGDLVSSESSIRSITIEASGKSISVEAKILREGSHIATVGSKFFIKGKFSQDQPIFKIKDEPLIELKIQSDIDEVVLKDRTWLHLDDPSISLVGKTLLFQVHTSSQWASQNSATNLTVRGTVEEKLWNGNRRSLGFVVFNASESQGNPVLEFLQRKGEVIDGRVPLKNPGWTGDSEVSVVAPSHTHLYAKLSGDCNPIHGSPVFAEIAELPGPIMHGMYTMAVSRRLVEDIVVPGEPERLRRFDASFVSIVRPGDRVAVKISHVAMKNGQMIFEVLARLEESDEEVLRGEAEITQPSTAYVFTGQGSQSVGMGMALYDSCPVAKSVYDEMDNHIRKLYGFSILKIIRENPKEITLHFRGREGQKILSNYLKLKTELPTEDGSRRSAPIIPGLSPSSTSYTFSEARGLLFATHFAQPAIILVEKATFEHLRSKGLIQEGAMFSGHSLGEYGALSSMAPFVDFKDMLDTAFYRGLMMQFAIPRDVNGQTGFSMMAANPGRVGKHFSDNALKTLIRYIAQESGKLLEIVNLNVEGDQYVCAGHVHNLSCLTEILNAVAERRVQPREIEEFLTAPSPQTTTFGATIAQQIALSNSLPLDVEIPRGKATILLKGIDVPFHSARMRFWIPTFRSFFLEHVKPEDIRLDQLAGNFVPNVVGKPFSLDKAFIREASKITGSTILEGLVH
ncbi:sterigmatocystin biosynthesis fatty acid synthase subunit beta [Xylaria sp. FL0064]|nr:sterigmatocystin biosynthesis fatty acid synthase subunit beta [Xylaria sp. FL0064]